MQSNNRARDNLENDVQEWLPSGCNVGLLLERYFTTIHRMVPTICQPEIENAFANRLHETSERFRLLILSVLSVAQGMETSTIQSRSGHSSVTALQLLTRNNGMPADPSSLGFEHVFADIAAFMTYSMRSDNRRAWFFLQQAITFSQLDGMDEIDSYKPEVDLRTATLRLKVYYTL